MIPFLLLVALLAAFSWQLFYRCFRRDLAWVPGPFHVRATNLWRFTKACQLKQADAIRALHDKYGKLVRIGPNIVDVADPIMINQIFGHRTNFSKSDSVKPWAKIVNGKSMPGIVDTQDSRRNAELKRPISHVFSVQSIGLSEPFIDDTLVYFIKRIDEEFITGINAGKRLPIHAWLQYFAFDIISEMTISKRYGFLEVGKDVDGQLEEIDRELEYRLRVGNMPWLHNFLRGNSLYRRIYSKPSKFAATAVRLINDRRTHGSTHPERQDMMSQFLKSKETHPETVNDAIVQLYVITNILAGSDMTAIVMRTGIYYALKNPTILARLRSEFDAAGLTYPPPYKVVLALPYFNAFMREALRIHPATSFTLERVVPPGGMSTPDGHTLPSGTIVAASPWSIHFNKDIYGADVDTFNPDRWLQGGDESDEAYKQRLMAMKSNDMSFSKGPRVCLGMHVAEQELWKAIPTLLGLFDMRLADSKKDWTVTKGFMAKQSDMDVIVSWRAGKSLQNLSR